jgi:CheY-like chemotaxis protein
MRKDFVMIVAMFFAMSRASPFLSNLYVASVTCGSAIRQVIEKRKVFIMVAWKTDVDILTLHTVLIVSDQPQTAAVWDSLFNQRNCIVLYETNIPDALQSARLVGPSLMLIDMQLSDSERSALLRGLRASSRGPILMLISANTVDEIVEANRAGADECLVKPVNPAVLIVKAMAWLGHGQRTERMPLATGVNATV